MNHSEEPLDPREEALVRALRAEAETVRPAGDGLVRIRARVERRRSRTRWVLPTASAATVAATVTAVVASGGFGGGKHATDLGIDAASLTAATTPAIAVTTKAKHTAATATIAALPSAHLSARATPLASARALASETPDARTTTSAPAPTSGSVVASDVTPSGPTPVWPFADVAAAASWQRADPAGSAWQLDPVQTATRFVNGLKLTGLAIGGQRTVNVSATTATVTLQRADQDHVHYTPFVTVELSHWAAGPKAPWGVVAVTSPWLTVSAPAAGARIGGGFDVAYSAPAITEGQFEAAAYEAGSTTALVRSTVTSPDTMALPPRVPSGPGYVVVTATSGGGPAPTVGGLAVVPVQISEPAPAYAEQLVELVGGKIEVVDTVTGSTFLTLAPGAQGVQGVAVTDDDKWVYFASTKGVFRTPLDGSGTPTLVSSDPASHIAVAGRHGEQLVYTYVSPDGQAQHLTWKTSGGAGTIQISQSLPPEAETLAINPAGTQIASYVRPGNEGNVALFSVPTTTALSQSTTPAECVPTACAGATYAPNGDLLYAISDGTTVSVHRQHAGKNQDLFHVAASVQTVQLDTDSTGTEVLLLQPGGPGWRWDGNKTTALPAGVTDASW